MCIFLATFVKLIVRQVTVINYQIPLCTMVQSYLQNMIKQKWHSKTRAAWREQLESLPVMGEWGGNVGEGKRMCNLPLLQLSEKLSRGEGSFVLKFRICRLQGVQNMLQYKLFVYLCSWIYFKLTLDYAENRL